MKKLIVGSVFANDNPDQQLWLDLQLKFLRATTVDFDHIVVLSDGLTNDYFESKTKVLVPENTQPKASEAHFLGLNRLTQYFLQHQDQYENFLYMDADAFPIKQNWLGALLKKMQPEERVDYQTGAFLTNKSKGRHYDIAAVLRSENLESRLHASVLFVKTQALHNISFELGIAGDDLAGNPESDVFIPAYQRDLRRLAFPLIRTNKNNVHPLACGIYFDMFYHHACGSGRPFNLRAADHYMASFIPSQFTVSNFTEKLMANPCEFVHKLAGWNTIRYANLDE
jgi:hypothetical protein